MFKSAVFRDFCRMFKTALFALLVCFTTLNAFAGKGDLIINPDLACQGTVLDTCSPGYYKTECLLAGGYDCTQCPAGTYKEGTNTATSCSECPSGTHYTGTGATSPDQCCQTGYDWDGTTCAPNTFTVKLMRNYNSNDTTQIGSDITATYGQALPSVSPPTRDGFVFGGYWDTSDSTDGTRYYERDGTPKSNSWNGTEDVTLYARWVPVYRITLSSNDGSNSEQYLYAIPDSDTRVSSGVYFDPEATNSAYEEYIQNGDLSLPERVGYTFTGYYSMASGGDIVIDANGFTDTDSDEDIDDMAVNSTGPFTVYAHWNPNETALTFDSKLYASNNAATGTVPTVDPNTNKEVTIIYGQGLEDLDDEPVDIPELDDYSFDGYWTTKSTGGVQVVFGDGYFNEDAFTAFPNGGSVTVYAHWNFNPYSCSAGTYFDDNACVPCVTGSHSSAEATTCRACGLGTTTTGPGQTRCNTSCGNVDHVSGWENVLWNSDNKKVTGLCKVTSCDSGYHVATLADTIGTNVPGERFAYINDSGVFTEANDDSTGTPTYNGTPKGQSYYGITDPKTWVVDFGADKGFVYGTARCSAQGQGGKGYGDATSADDITKTSSFSDTTGRQCWCNITGYKDANGKLQDGSSVFVLQNDKGNTEYCEETCSRFCAQDLWYYSDHPDYLHIIGDYDDGEFFMAWRGALLGTVNAACVENTYTLTLKRNYNASDSTVLGTVSAAYGQSLPSVTPPTRTGYDFGGYYDDNNVQYYNADGTSARNWDKTENTTLYAHWVATLQCDAGTFFDDGVCTPCAIGSYSAARATECFPCKNGKTTTGTGQTSCNADCPNKDAGAVFDWVDTSWAPNTVTNLCTVANCNAGYHIENTLKDLDTSTAGTRTYSKVRNYENTGTVCMSSNASSGSSADCSKSIYSDLDVWEWKDNFGYGYVYGTSSCHDGACWCAATKAKMTDGTEYIVEDPVWIRYGASPYCWHVCADNCGTNILSSGSYTTQIRATMFGVNKEALKCLPNTYNVTLKRNYTASDSTVLGTVSAAYGQSLPSVTPPTTRTGYDFEGYYDENDVQYYNADGTSAHNLDKTEDTNLYAHWTPKTYNVYLYKNGLDAIAGTTMVAATYNSPMPTPITLPTRPGYRFDGYYALNNSTKKYYNADGTSASNWDVSAGGLLKAHWVRDCGADEYLYEDLCIPNGAHAIRYITKADDGPYYVTITDITPSWYTTSSEDQTIVPSREPTMSGYTFIGWNSSSMLLPFNTHGQKTFTIPADYSQNIGVTALFVTNQTPMCSEGQYLSFDWLYGVAEGNVTCNNCPTGYTAPGNTYSKGSCYKNWSCPANLVCPEHSKLCEYIGGSSGTYFFTSDETEPQHCEINTVCEDGYVFVNNECKQSKFALVTTEDTDSFQFKLSARGSYAVDCGDGGTLSGNGVTAGTNIIDRSQITSNDLYTCTYSSAGAHTISFDGTTYGYTSSSEVATIDFRVNYKNAVKVAAVYGSLGALFPTKTAYPLQPLFVSTFQGCTNLKTVPASLFSNISRPASYMFKYTFQESGLTSIPEGLFSGFSAGETQMFKGTFSGCTSLKTLPSGLFAGISTGAQDMFYDTFYYCSGLESIPSDLFGDNITVGYNMFQRTFIGCSALKSVPSGLFRGVSETAPSLFYDTFAYCTNLKTIPADLFANISGTPESAMLYGMFRGDTSLDTFDWGDGKTTHYIPPQFFESISSDASSLMGYIFYNTSVATECPLGYKTYTTGFESYLNYPNAATEPGQKVSCEPKQYTVTLNAMGGSGGTESVTATYDSPLPTNGLVMPTRVGYSFEGYYDEQNGGIQYYDRNGASESVWDKTDDNPVLYAHWNPITFNVSYNGNGNDGGVAPSGPASCAYDGICTALANTYTKTGHSFAGWTCTASTGSCAQATYAVGDSISNATTINGATITLTAQWTEDIPLECTSDQINIDGTCYNGKFIVKTTDLNAGETFKFSMSATGTFTVDCGTGGQLSSATDDVVGNTITRSNTTMTQYTCTYSNSPGVKYIVFDGLATGYNPSDVHGGATAAINFSSYSTGTNNVVTHTPHNIDAIYGSLGAIFPTLNDGSDDLSKQPRFYETFARCTRLTSLPNELFCRDKENGECVSGAASYMFGGTFYGCTGLTSLPTDLFDGISSAAFYMFGGTFSGCTGLTSLPKDSNGNSTLFKNVSGAANNMFEGTFSGCTGLTSLPNRLFYGISGAKKQMFRYTFDGCTGLTSLPTDLFDGVSGAADGLFLATFKDCTGLTSLPKDSNGNSTLFKNVSGHEQYMFQETFKDCTGLTSLPTNLFGGVSGAADFMFYGTFSDCTGLTSLPKDSNGNSTLFKNVSGAAPSMFFSTFSGCSGLISLPNKLFCYDKENGKCISGAAHSMFGSTFSGCTSLTSLPTDLFDGVSGAAEQMFITTFFNCSGLTTIPMGLFDGASGSIKDRMFKRTFYNAVNLDTVDRGNGVTTNYIPGDFLNNVNNSVTAQEPATDMFAGTQLDDPCPASTADVTREIFEYAGKPWCSIVTNVILNANGGSGGTESVTATYGYAMPTENVIMPTYTGHTFEGYYDQQSGGTQYYNAAGASARNWDKTDNNATLYAHWTENANTCPEGTYFDNGVCYSCSEATNGEYTQSAALATSIDECFRPCIKNDINHSVTVVGNKYYGIPNTCSAVTCETNYIPRTLSDIIGTDSASGGSSGYDSSFMLAYGDAEKPLTITGQGRCSNQTGTGVYTNPAATTSGDVTVLNDVTSDANGTNCWCKLDGYVSEGLTISQFVSSPWVFHSDNFSGCTDTNCASYCAADLDHENMSKFRAAVFESVNVNFCDPRHLTITFAENTNDTVIYMPEDNPITCIYGSCSVYGVRRQDENGYATLLPERAGYTFVEWNTRSDGSGDGFAYISIGAHGGAPRSKRVDLDGLFDITNNSTVTLYAIWEPNTYIVTYDHGVGGSGSMPDGSAIYNANFTPDAPGANTITKPNARFSGWDVSDTDDTKLAGVPFLWQYSQNKTFTAVWVCNTGYTLNENTGNCDSKSVSLLYFDSLDNTEIETQPQICTYDNDFNLPPAPTRSGFRFAGWEIEEPLQLVE